MPLMLLVLAALAMSVGWGFRGNYGHEVGAMVPGALLGLSISLGSRRPDWQARGITLGFLGAVGWAFGGQMSYAKIVGYTCASSYPDVLYGYVCLFFVGALWAGIGAGILALGLTESSEELDNWCGPLVILWIIWKICDAHYGRYMGVTGYLSQRFSFYDSDWVAAISAILAAGISALFLPRSRSQAAWMAMLASGWLLSFFILTGVCRLRMTPPRSDNWAGCLGVFVVLLIYLIRQKNRAGLFLLSCGVLAGGFGFATTDLLQVLGRAQWGTIGGWARDYQLDFWKWMEQGFGLVMGAGVALGAAWLMVRRLASPGDLPPRKLDRLGIVYLVIVLMWENLHKNVLNWEKAGALPATLFNVPARWWIMMVALLLSTVILVAFLRQTLGKIQLSPPGILGRVRWLFLLLLWIALVGDFTQTFPTFKDQGVFFVQFTFWITAGICSLLVVLIPEGFEFAETPIIPANDYFWKSGRIAFVGIVLAAGILPGLALWSVRSHPAPLYGSHLRFESDPVSKE